MKKKSIASKHLKEYILEKEIDFVGIAPVSRFANAPEGRRPTDLFPESRSVISIGIKLTEGAVKANQMAWKGLRHAAFSYMLYCYANLNWVLAGVAHSVSRFIEGRGHIALPIPPSPPSNSEELYGMFSNRHAAVACGLGEFGWNSLLIMPKAAGRVRLVSVLTDADLEPDPLYHGPRLCNPVECGFLCVQACPVSAISKESSVELRMDERVYRYALIDKYRCTLKKIMGKGPYRPPIGDVPSLPDGMITFEESREFLKRANPLDNGEAATIGRADRCAQCIMVCPVGLTTQVKQRHSGGGA